MRADVPVLQVVLSGSTREAWAESGRGLSPADLAMNVVLPELDGRLLTRAISFKAEAPIDPRLEFASVRHRVRARSRRLRRAGSRRPGRGSDASSARAPAGADALSDYPARGGRTGYAVGLDTTESALEILRMLRDEGYDTGEKEWRPPDIGALLDRTRTPSAMRQGDVLLQPDRGSGYHDISAEPSSRLCRRLCLAARRREDRRAGSSRHARHAGMAARQGAGAVGRMLARAVLGALPVIYPFIVNNPGEAVQAKRRLAAVTIGHLTPPLSAAGLDGPLAELEGLVEEYAAADGLNSRRLRYLGEEIVDRAWTSGLAADCGLVRGEANREAHRQARCAALRHQGSLDPRQPACLRPRGRPGVRGLRRRRARRVAGAPSTAGGWRAGTGAARRRAAVPTCCRPAAT